MQERMRQYWEGKVRDDCFFSFGTTENGRKGRAEGSEKLYWVFFNLSKYGSFFCNSGSLAQTTGNQIY